MERYKEEFIEFMVDCNVLKFGDFVTKSGRKTPFFVNTGFYPPEAEAEKNSDGTVTIHKKSCPVANDLASKEGHRIVSAKWSKHFMMSYLARISLEGIDRVGVLSDLTRVISLVLGVNMRKLHIETHDEIFEGFIDLYVHNTDDLDKLIRALSKVKGIERVKRVDIN